MAKTLSYPMIVGILKQQQEIVGVIDKYIQPILLDLNMPANPKICADFVMAHIFVNIRNSYQDSISISQTLIKNQPYYISTGLSHAQRTAQEFLIDLAYIVRDKKNKSGCEYLRYFKFIVDKEKEESGKSNFSEDQYNKIFPPKLNLKRKSKTEWSHTSRKGKIEKGLKFYKIEPDHFADFRFKMHAGMSSTAHGNANTIYTLIRTPEENLTKLTADLKLSIGHFENVLKSALECYIKLYLGRNKDYREIAESVYPDNEV